MLATFIIGLREGLEAALIVGIIAAFLRRNGRSLTPMLLGVGAAIVLSIGVGVTLKLIEQSLPQAAQEGMEAVIGLVAVVFVTTMVVWMSGHARGLKGDLEASATAALSSGSSGAMVLMAFLAVLKEGFETAVFLLATFSASSNAALAAAGAGLGLLTATAIGYGLYSGGLRLNLAKFFQITGVFLLLVAAGLVVNALGAMRAAGWIEAGQQRIADLSWLAPPGSVQGALLTGVLGIPLDPTLIQAIGWFGYLIPMALYLYWPRRLRPDPRLAVRLRAGIAGAVATLAAALFVLLGPASMPALGAATVLDDGGRPAGTIHLEDDRAILTTTSGAVTMPLDAGTPGPHLGVPDAELHRQDLSGSVPAVASLTIEDLVALNGGRIPVGIDPQVAAGPFRVTWSHSGERRLWITGGEVLDFSQSEATLATLSDGGLPNPRTLTVSGRLPDGTTVTSGALSVEPAPAEAAATAATQLRSDQRERRFWGRTVPLLLLATAAVIAATALRVRRRIDADDPTRGSELPQERNIHVS